MVHGKVDALGVFRGHFPASDAPAANLHLGARDFFGVTRADSSVTHVGLEGLGSQISGDGTCGAHIAPGHHANYIIGKLTAGLQ